MKSAIIKEKEKMKEKQSKELYILFRDYHLLIMEATYISEAMFMLDITKSPVAIKLSEHLGLVRSRIYSLLARKKAEVEDKIGFII